jgi:hypothetical protein
MLIPDFSNSASAYSGEVITLSAGFQLQPTTRLILELPMVHGTYISLSQNVNQTAIGNPYIGIKLTPPESMFWGEAGVRIPLTLYDDITALTIGVLSDGDRLEAYSPDILQVSMAINFATDFSPPFGVRLRLGPAIDMSTTVQRSGDAFLHYAALLQYSAPVVELQGGYVAKTLIGRSGISNRTRDYVEFHGAAQFHKIRPGVQVRFPLSEYDKILVDAVYGLSLEVIL